MKNKLALLTAACLFLSLFISCKENVLQPDCKITFFNLEGSNPDPITVKYGHIITEQDLPVLTNPGYEFAGWYDGTKKVEPGIYKVTKNVLFDAKWESFECTVTFRNFLGDDAPAPQKYISSEKHRFSPEELPDLKHDHYQFLGWFDEEGTLVRHGTYQVTKSVVLTAKWQGSDLFLDYCTGNERYKFEPSNGIVYVSHDELPKPERDGYVFKYWATEPNSNQSRENFYPENDTLYAVWSKLSTITFKNTDLEPQQIRDDVYVQTPNSNGSFLINFIYQIPKKEGKIFLGWYADEECTEIFSLKTGNFITQDITIYAKWKDVGDDTVKISFVTNSDEIIDDIYVIKHSQISIGNHFVYSKNREFYYFYYRNTQNPLMNGDKYLTGWYLDENFENLLDPEGYIDTDCTLYAKYGKRITLTCDFNDGSGQTQNILAYEGASHIERIFNFVEDNFTTGYYSLPTKSKEGFAITGWYKEPECLTLCDDEVLFTDDTTIYAKWSPIITLTFVTNCDTKIDPVNIAGGVYIYFVSYGGNSKEWNYMDPAQNGFTKITPLTKDGYEFDGWYTDSECTIPCDKTKVFTEDTTVYAKWK